jgi:photosystem II stability/assembly factor-like uncharacterized protein
VAGGTLYTSTDAGKTWTKAVGKALSQFCAVGSAVGYSNEAQPTLYFAGGDGLCASADHGGTWSALLSLSDGAANSVTPHPAQPGVVYASFGAGDLYRSRTGGASFTRLHGHEAPDGIAFGAITAVPGLPSLLLATSNQGLLKSTDEGATWTQASASLGSLSVETLLVVSAPSSTTLLAFTVDSTNKRALYRSADAAATWSPVALSFALPPSLRCAVDASTGAIACGGAGSRTLLLSNGPGTDWTTAPGPADTYHPDNRLYAVAAAQGALFVSGGSLFRSPDRQSWTKIFNAQPIVGAVVADPHDPKTLYLSDGELQLSHDSGATWALKVSQSQVVVYDQVVPDPATAGWVYATSRSGLLRTLTGFDH